MNARERRDDRPVWRDQRWGTLRAHPRVAQEELSPRAILAPPLERAAIDERPAVKIVIDLTREDEAIDERRVEEQLLKALQRAEPDQIAAADPNQILADVKMPVLVGDIAIANNRDLSRIADAEAVLVRETDVRQ